jgi:hypothetical protein
MLGEADGHCQKEKAVTLASGAKRGTREKSKGKDGVPLSGSLTVDWSDVVVASLSARACGCVDRSREGFKDRQKPWDQKNIGCAQNRSKDRPLELVRA